MGPHRSPLVFLLITVFWMAGCGEPELVTAVQEQQVAGEPRPEPSMMVAEPEATLTFRPGCAAMLDGTLALFTFDGSIAEDSLGRHVGEVLGGTLDSVDGPADCGSAVSFPADNAAYIRIPDAEAWDLDQGSIDFWLRPGQNAPGTTILSRDANETDNNGHFMVDLSLQGELTVRIQSVGRSLEFSAPVENEWSHVGINWGAPGLELFIDHESKSWVPVGSGWGIAGNDNPWSVGGSQAHSDEGTEQPIEALAQDLALDHLRISSMRRDFSEGQ